jgi:hypothetical protein
MDLQYFVERELARETEALGENLSQCFFVHNEFQMLDL